MTLPAFLFGALLATLYGAGFHLLRGGGLGRLVLFMILSWMGFWTGQVLAGRFGWTIASLGPLHLFTATLFSLVFLGIGHWLTKMDNPAGKKMTR
jgi:hypothetical protein